MTKSTYTTKSDFIAMLELMPPTIDIVRGGAQSTTPLRNYLWGMYNFDVLLAEKPHIEIERLATDHAIRSIWFTHLRSRGWEGFIRFDSPRTTTT